LLAIPDVMRTYQIGGNGGSDYGHTYKVVPMTTEKFLNVLHCFVVDGDASNPVQPQTVLPDVSSFNVSLHCFLFFYTAL